jgi:lipoprotein-anchoring transpeptidase ErfK/SrfK
MKTPALLLAVAALAGCAGCATIKSELSRLPPASAASANFELSGKFTSTTVTAKNYVNDGRTIKADALTFDHSDPWVTKLHWEGTQVSLQINP